MRLRFGEGGGGLFWEGLSFGREGGLSSEFYGIPIFQSSRSQSPRYPFPAERKPREFSEMAHFHIRGSLSASEYARNGFRFMADV